MNFRESVDYLISLGNEVSAMKLGLENIRALLSALGDPQNSYIKVQVAGTNGKGSVCAFLDAICREAGIKTGVLTSPHLVSITERVRIDGKDIIDEDFARYATRIRDTSEELLATGGIASVPTFFEQGTAIALLAFADARVELAILETGLGGRLDATTAAKAEIAAITRIDLDHQEYLGESLTEIAGEKAAIINPHSVAVIGQQDDEARKVISERCCEVGVEPIWATPDIDTENSQGGLVYSFQTDRRTYAGVKLGFAGRHQAANAAVAIGIAEALLQHGFAISESDIRTGLANAKHPGRLERRGRFLFDGAHNVAGARALKDYLDEFEQGPFTLVFGVMEKKDFVAMICILLPKARTVVLTRPDNPRAVPPETIAAHLGDALSGRVVLTGSTADALARATEISSADNSLIVVTGSLYLVGEARKILNN
ncbi:MAG: folylpolyglutamate synthase/dihydrofolate synthase family protein [Pyrinomonadaceae bacterium]